MEYILENANIRKTNHSFLKRSIQVNNRIIRYIKTDSFPFSRSMRVDLSSYVLTPGHVMLLENLHYSPFNEFKTNLLENYITRGCTTLLSLFTVHREQEFTSKLKAARANMLNSPLDFYFAVRIPIRSLTPSFVRKCKKNKIAAVFIEMDEVTSIRSLPWGWIKDALYQFPITFLPCWKNPPSSKKGKMVKEWKVVMKQEKLSHSEACPEEGKPLDLDLLMKIGIYPTKGDLRVGGELDYNLYLAPEGRIIETMEDLDYDSHIPEVTVQKGTIIKAGKEMLFRPGFGNECTVTIPGHFLLTSTVRSQ